jgi:hypothetical protein
MIICMYVVCVFTIVGGKVNQELKEKQTLSFHVNMLCLLRKVVCLFCLFCFFHHNCSNQLEG